MPHNCSGWWLLGGPACVAGRFCNRRGFSKCRTESNHSIGSKACAKASPFGCGERLLTGAHHSQWPAPQRGSPVEKPRWWTPAAPGETCSRTRGQQLGPEQHKTAQVDADFGSVPGVKSQLLRVDLGGVKRKGSRDGDRARVSRRPGLTPAERLLQAGDGLGAQLDGGPILQRPRERTGERGPECNGGAHGSKLPEPQDHPCRWQNAHRQAGRGPGDTRGLQETHLSGILRLYPIRKQNPER